MSSYGVSIPLLLISQCVHSATAEMMKMRAESREEARKKNKEQVKVMKQRRKKRDDLCDAKLVFYQKGAERNASWNEDTTGKLKERVAGKAGVAVSLLKAKWPDGVLIKGKSYKDVRKIILDIEKPTDKRYSKLLLLAGSLERNEAWDLNIDYIEDLIS